MVERVEQNEIDEERQSEIDEEIAETEFRRMLENARDVPKGNELRLTADMFCAVTKNWVIYPPFFQPDAFRRFMNGLTTTIVNDEWTPQIIVVKPQPIYFPFVPRSIESTLDIYYINRDGGTLQKEGDYGFTMIREGVEKPFETMGILNFGQTPLARAIDPLLAGTNLIASYANEFPYRTSIETKRSITDRIFRRHYPLEVYLSGVRYLNIKLIDIDQAVGKVYEEMLSDHTEKESHQQAGQNRLRYLQSVREKYPDTFLLDMGYREGNVNDVPAEIQSELERRNRELDRQAEQMVKGLRSGLRKINKIFPEKPRKQKEIYLF